MEAWRRVWREGFAPLIPLAGLVALRDALASDDPRLIQGATTTPPPLACVAHYPCEAACALSLAGWIGEDLETVGDVEGFFCKLCFEADQRLKEPAACRWFLNWFDDTPRPEALRELLGEVETAIAERETAATPTIETNADRTPTPAEDTDPHPAAEGDDDGAGLRARAPEEAEDGARPAPGLPAVRGRVVGRSSPHQPRHVRPRRRESRRALR